ncbi:cell division protein FtsK [bacterium]|nr:cell division protein FtsK [bacterium]|tara:strand:+ start:9831 stop:12128 length:2298 start_codon:yes stop_codon:yes gene_type:complete
MAARRSTVTKKKSKQKGGDKRGRKRRAEQPREEVESASLPPIQSETLRGVWAVLAIATAVFFLLAWFGFAGKVGAILYIWLSALFGIGYVLVPVLFVLVAFVLFRSIEHEKIGVLKIAGALIFFLAGLGFIETLFPNRGGLVGQLISSPLVYAVDTVATVVALLALIIVSLLITFDAQPHRAFPTIARWMGRDEEEPDEVHILEENEEAAIELETTRAEAESNDEEVSENEEGPSTKSPGIFNFGDSESSRSMFNFATSGSSAYTPPPLSLLQKDKGKPSVGDVKASANTIKRTLQNFGIDVEMDEVSIGPTVTRYAMKPAEGVRLAKIVSLQSNLELALAATPIRIEAPIPGKSLVGVEVPNNTKSMLGLASIFGDRDFQNSDKPLLVALGRDIAGKPHYANISKMPHLLIAGATGAGKSVTVHDMIVSLLYRRGPRELRFVMVDPKRVELTLYNDIPHLLTPVITEPKKAILALKWLAKEMDRRYDVLEAEKVRDIASYHANVYEPAKKRNGADEDADMPEPMPYIVAVIDEMADLMTAYPRELEAAIVRLAQMSRAVGIHLVLSTQRPSVQVITGLIKANIPSRIALQVSSQIDSRTILDMGGAEKLLGAGDMLYLSGEMSKPRRIQAPYISEEEVKKVVKYLVDAHDDELPDEIDLSEVQHDNSIFAASVGGGDDDGDDLYDEARRVITEAGKGSTSFLQRKLRVGYARAARLMDMLEERGVVGPADGSKPREVIRDADSSPEELKENKDEYDSEYEEENA